MLDSHHHLWKASRGDYHWMTPDVEILARDYLVSDIEPELRKSGITKTILVQAAQTVEETDFLLNIAESTDFILGVVGWLDMEDEAFPEKLAEYRLHPKFVAVRPMLQGIDDDAWILRERVLCNLEYMAETGFPFEFLTYTRHLPYVEQVMTRVPNLRAVIDHMSKPPIASQNLDPWAGYIERLSKFENLYCKISGMVTEADHDTWTPEDLTPYIDHVVKCFGPERLMFGSDWPVCRLAAEYGDVIHATRLNVSKQLSHTDCQGIFNNNGLKFYKLDMDL